MKAMNKKVIKQKRIKDGGVNLHLECGHIIRIDNDPKFRIAVSACKECEFTMATKDITDKQVVQATIDARKHRVLNALDFLEVATQQPRKVCFRAMERASKRDLIDYGVSLHTAWPTEEGLAIME